jgi:choline dehydrogenase-like flavoprotein
VSIKPKNPVASPEPLMRRNVTPHVDVGYFNDSRDLTTLKEGWEAFGPVRGCLEVFPFLLFRPLHLVGMDWFRCYCSSFILPYFHFCGTCRLETDGQTDWVVDTTLRLREHSGLSICDASVFPTMVSAPPALTCAALGHAFSRVLLSNNIMPTVT